MWFSGSLTPPDGTLRGWNHGTTLPTVLYTAALCTALTVGLGFVLRRLASLRLNDRALGMGRTKEDAVRHIAVCSVAGAVNTFLGPFALAIALGYAKCASDSDTPFTSDAQLLTSDWIYWHNLGALAGEIFTGYILYMTVMLLVGWDDWGVDTLIHHLLFLSVGLLLAGTSTYVKLAAWAISMECSSPPLLLYFVARQLEGPNWGRIAPAAQLCFGLSFLGFRCIGYTYGYLDCVVAVAGNPGLMPLPRGLNAVVLLIFGAGWVLQFIWLREIIMKSRRQSQKREAEPALTMDEEQHNPTTRLTGSINTPLHQG